MQQAAKLLVLVVACAAVLADVHEHGDGARLLGAGDHLVAERRVAAQPKPERRGAGLALGGDRHAQVELACELVPNGHDAHGAFDADDLKLEVVGVGRQRVQAALVAARARRERAPPRDPGAPRRVGFGVEDDVLDGVDTAHEHVAECEREAVGEVRGQALPEAHADLQDVLHAARRRAAPQDRGEVQLRRVEVELVKVVARVVPERDDGLAPNASCELQDGIVAHCVADSRLALVRHDALAVAVEELDAHLVVERRDELAIGVARLFARLPGVFDTARAAELELALDGAL